MGHSDELVAKLMEMGYSEQMIAKAFDETKGKKFDPDMIMETLLKYSASSEEASSSKSKLIDHFISMGFSEIMVIKAIQEFGDENLDEITNGLLSYAEIEKLRETEDKDITLPSDHDDDDLYSGLLSSDEDEENELNSNYEDSRLRDLVRMQFSRDDAARAIERCGENASVAEIIDFICASHMAREFDAVLDEEEARVSNKKRRTDTELPERVRKPNDELIRLPNPMVGFGVPSQSRVLTKRPIPIPEVARGPPYFYYENVAMAPKGVWTTISRRLYGIVPEFVDSQHFCAAARKRGYIHNLPIANRFQIQPPPPLTIKEAFPMMERWWPTWDRRTKLNCLLTCIGSARLTSRLRTILERYDGEPALDDQTYVINKCKKWNLVWVGKNKLAPLEPNEMEKLLGFPIGHTRGGITKTDQYKSLGNAFQVDTVAYHLSVLKALFPDGIKVLSLFTGIGGGEVALYRLEIPMKVVVSVEISEVNRNIMRSFWDQTNQTGILVELSDVQALDSHMIEKIMDKYGGFDLVIGGSPCNNLAGGNRRTRTGLEGAQSSLFYDYCRILDAVRDKAARMRR